MKDPRVSLVHILESITNIEAYVAGGEEFFMKDKKTQDAVIRNFEIIGEAAKRISSDFHAVHPKVPWRQLAAFRDVLIHQYDVISLSAAWKVIVTDLPQVKQALQNLLPPLDTLEREVNGE